MKRCFLIFALAVLSSGCAHRQIRYNINQQAISVHQTIEKQVLDNLAMFYAEGDGVPFLSVPDEGASNVDDSGAIEGGAPLNPFFTTLGFNSNRSMGNSWTLKPVVLKSQLESIRVLLKKNKHLIDCTTNRSEIPKCCTIFGEYCGRYVWVLDGCETDFANLVLDILGAASGIETQETKLVTVYIDKDGAAVCKEDSVGKVEIEIAFDADPVGSATQIADATTTNATGSPIKTGKKVIDDGKRFIPDSMFRNMNRLNVIQSLDAASGSRARRRDR